MNEKINIDDRYNLKGCEVYYLVTFPDVQALMELEGFDEHSCVCVDVSGAYFVEKQWADSKWL